MFNINLTEEAFKNSQRNLTSILWICLLAHLILLIPALSVKMGKGWSDWTFLIFLPFASAIAALLAGGGIVIFIVLFIIGMFSSSSTSSSSSSSTYSSSYDYSSSDDDTGEDDADAERHGILRSPGENYYDGNGILRSPGENYYIIRVS